MMFGWYPIRVSPFFMPSIKFRYYHSANVWGYNEVTEKRKEPEMKFTKTHDKQMSVPIKIAEIDLSFFTGDPTWLVLTAEESTHGYDYTLTCYRGNDSKPLGHAGRCTFYDQQRADTVANFMAAKIKEILG